MDTDSPLELEAPGAPDVFLPALVLATIGAPPRGNSRMTWEQTVSAYRREIALLRAEPDGAAPGSLAALPVEDLRLGDAVRTRRLAAARQGVERALAAAHAAMPFVVNSVLVANSATRTAPAAYASPQSRTAQIERVLLHEVGLREQMESAGSAPPPRVPAWTGSSAAIKNFWTRVDQPARPILHLAIALAQGIDAEEREIAKRFGTPERWQAEGYGTYAIKLPDGGERFRPQLNERHILLWPALARQTCVFAEAFRPGVEEFLGAGRASRPPRSIRLTIV